MTEAWTPDDAAGRLRKPTASDDKYSRGVLGVRTGSDRYPGAAVLGVEAAWRTGVGMVRYVGPHAATGAVLARRPETVSGVGRVQAWLIGSGTDAGDRAPEEAAALRDLARGDVPVVVDAGALDIVAETAAGDRAPMVVTPHASEHDRLRAALGLPAAGADRAAAAAETAAAAGVTVLLKGGATIVATPTGWVRGVDAPTTWLATAGTGDVLGGVLGALVAVSGVTEVEQLGPLAATAAWIHGEAAVVASTAVSGGPVTASDVAAHVPVVVGRLLAAR